VPTQIIQTLRTTFTQNGIRIVPDDQVKHMSGFSYYGIHRNSHCLYLTHVFTPETFLQVHIPVPNQKRANDVVNKTRITYGQAISH
jgi:hypothetical protein